MKCPICTGPMPALRKNSQAGGVRVHAAEPSVTCSDSCRIILTRWAHWMRDQRGVDEAVVDRLTCGSRVDSIKSERLEATRILSHWGHSIALIAERLHVTQRSVVRYRHELLLQRSVQL